MRISDWSSDVCSSDLHEIFEQRRTALAGFQRILIIRNPVTEIVGEIGRAPRALIAGVLMKLAALAGDSLDCRRAGDRKSGVSGKSVSVRVDLGGLRLIKKNKKTICHPSVIIPT